MTFAPPPALEGLDPEQMAAASALDGPVCIIAGAGTGKTRTVTHRLAHAVRTGRVAPGTALAVTHSRKAAAELADRLHRLGASGVQARTFHAAALVVARDHWAATGRPGTAPSVMGEPEQWRAWRSALQAVLGRAPDNAEVRDLSDEVSWARSRLVSLEGYEAAAQEAGRLGGLGPGVVAKSWARYQRGKDRLAKVDFADLLDIASAVIVSEPSVAAAVRRHWAYLTVDEYQDTDPAQQRLLEAVLGDGKDICVVGDPRQAIYSWKGADPGYLTGFSRRFPEARTFDLTQNYRSCRQVLDWANRLARSGGTRPLVATQPDARRPRVTQLDNEQAEAAWVAGAAKRAVATGTPVSEIAVLYRFGSAQARLEAAFVRAGVPVNIADDVTFFEREEVLAVLRPFGADARARPEASGLELLGSALARLGFDRQRPPSGLGAARSRWESAQALLEMAEAMPERATATARGLLSELLALAHGPQGPGQPGVTLATLHKSKGLEWDVVFIVGVMDKVLPSLYAETPEELAEEERLLHVGVTRARRELHVTWPASSNRGWANQPSPFLDLLPTGTGTGRTVGGSGPRGGKAGTSPKPNRPTRGAEGRRADSRAAPRLGTAECPHCAVALKGPAARHLGVCAGCVLTVPGRTGEAARALRLVVEAAAQETGVPADLLVGPVALLRLLDQRPADAGAVAGTAGVGLRGGWADKAADVLTA